MADTEAHKLQTQIPALRVSSQPDNEEYIIFLKNLPVASVLTEGIAFNPKRMCVDSYFL